MSDNIDNLSNLIKKSNFIDLKIIQKKKNTAMISLFLYIYFSDFIIRRIVCFSIYISYYIFLNNEPIEYITVIIHIIYDIYDMIVT